MRHMMRRLYVDALWPTTWNEFLPIDADHGDRGIGCLRHGLLLVFGAPCQLRLLAGQEHGRTIPLADNIASRRVFFSIASVTLNNAASDTSPCRARRASNLKSTTARRRRVRCADPDPDPPSPASSRPPRTVSPYRRRA